MASLEQFVLEDMTILKLRGSLSCEGLDEVEREFAHATHRPGARVVVDLTGVDIVTTPALSMFIAAATEARNTGGRLVFTESTPPVKDILKRLRLTSVLKTVPGLEDAIKTVRCGESGEIDEH
jgi:anti-sigma B factor antagonist